MTALDMAAFRRLIAGGRDAIDSTSFATSSRYVGPLADALEQALDRIQHLETKLAACEAALLAMSPPTRPETSSTEAPTLTGIPRRKRPTTETPVSTVDIPIPETMADVIYGPEHDPSGGHP